MDDSATVQGTLHIYVAFDWGDEVDLARAAQLAPAAPHALPRRPRTPTSIDYRPAPLRYTLTKTSLDLANLGVVEAVAEATVFDFAAVSVALHVPLASMPNELRRLAGSLVNPEPLILAARTALEPLRQQLSPAIVRPASCEFTEEYFVFELLPEAPLPPPAKLLGQHGEWLAGLVRLESGPLSEGEVQEALRQRLSYTPEDLALLEWGAAVLVDRECDEMLQVIEFANLQLLEFRELDNRLDCELLKAYGLIHSLARSALPYWRSHARPLRALGDLRIEASSMFDRASNALKLIGDQYLARLYRLLAARFHLEDWSESIERSLDAVEGVYQVLSDQGAMYRTELLEWIIIVLILFEIVMSLVGH